MADNISKFYKVFSAEYDNFATEKDFRDWLGKADAEKMGNLYKAFSSVYDNFGSSEEMNSYLGWGKKREPETAPVETISRSGGISRFEDVDSIGFRTKFQPAQAPSRGDTIPAKPTATAEEQAPVAQPAEPLPTPDIMWGGEQLNDFSQFETDLSGLSEDEKFIREYRKKREEAKREAYGSGGRGFYKPATDKEKWVADNQAKYEEIIGRQANPLRGMSAEELAQMGAEMEEERKFVEDYEKRAAAFKQAKKAAFTAAGKHTSEQMVDPAEREWLEQNKSRYADDKHKVELWHDAQGFTPEHKAVMAQNEHDSEIAREARSGSAIVERANWDSVLRINQMTEKVDNLGYKIDAKAGNADDKIYAAVSQFAKGAAGNVDIDTITFGLASGLSLTNARRVGDKYNNLVTKALEDVGFTGDWDTLQKDLQKTYEQLLPISNEVSALNKRLEEMVATYNDMAKSGASEEELKKYYSEYEKVYAEYKQKYDEYAPMRESFDKLQEESNKIVTSVQNAVENGLDDSEKALLKALDRYTAVTAMRATTTSSFAKAGQAAEQSAEFMLDFILTGGLGKASSKMATKILRNSVLRQAKERGALAVVENIPEAMSKLTAMGVKPNLGARFLAEAGEAGIRTAIMFPRSIRSFGENLTEIDAESPRDAFGRRNFDRSWLNSGFNTLLTQYIEYWSEGFGTYFGEAESALFKSVTHGAPITSIGKTLSAYRGSLGKYLDYGKFDGLFNEGLEEVAGSLLNAMAGAFSKDRVGDSQAMDDFFTAENLSVLFMSFLPMSIISAGTNINAYNKMKDRYNDSVEVLSGFIESGAVSQEDLDNLKSTILESTPVQIKDKIVAIADKARQTNGGRLPSNFTQSLMGYVEGSLAMDMEGERWTDSAEKVQVATAYADAYANPDVRGVWDATDMEEQALAEAKKAGFTDEELDTDPYRLGQKALLLQQTDEKKSAALLAYATAKAQRMGLEDGYKNNTANMIADFEESMRNNADVDGNLIMATTADGKSVYITAKDATIGNDGSVSVNGADGVVTYWSEEEGDKTAKASDLTVNAVVPTDAFIARSAVDMATRSDAYYQTMAHTVSARGRARAIKDKVGQTVYVSDGRGVYEPIKIVRMTDGGQKVVIKGNRGILDGISVMVQANIPRGSQMEVETARLYDVLAKDEDGSISSEAPASAPEAQAQQAPQAEAPVEEPAPAPAPRATETAPANGPAISDLQGNNYTIYINGTPYNVSVTRANERDGEVEVMYQDAEGNDIAAPEGLPGTFKYENFVQAMQAPEAAAQAEEQTAEVSSQPAEAPAQSAPATVEDSINDWLRQTIVSLFDPAMTDADRRDFVDAVEKKLTDLHNKREALVEKRETDKPTMTTDIQAFIKAKEELRKKYTDQIDALDKEIAVEEGRLAGLNAALNEINSRYMPFTPVGTKTRFTESELEPANPVEAAADFISKAVKNGDFAIDMDSFKKETGYNGESQKYRFLKKKGGLPIRVVAEMLAREYPGFFGGAANERDAYESGNEGDDNSARDAIITLFSETKNRSEIDNYILNRRKEQAKAEADRQNEEIMRVIEETFKVPFDEYATRKDELIREDLKEIIAFELPGESFLTNLREYYRNKFNDNVRPADNASDQTENGGDVAEGEDLLSRGGDEVLPGEQPDGAVGPEPVGGNSSAAESTGIDTGAANGAPQSGSGLQSSAAEGVDSTKEAIRKAISEWSEKLGVPVIAHESIDSIQSGTARNEIARADAARARGNNRARVEAWYNPTTNTVEFYLPHIESESRIAELVMHEIVSHKGLRALFGEKNWNRLMDTVWDSMSARQRAQWINYNSHLKGKSAAEMRRAAADECVAHVAETVKEGKGVGIWKKFVAEVKKLLIELGLGRYIRLNNNDLSAFLLDSLADYKKNAEAKPFPAEATPESKTEAELSDAIGSKNAPVADVVDGNTTEGTEMFSKTGDGRSLVGIHNISEEKLGKALRLGGLVNPSSAVLDLAFQNHFGYGDISLIMPSSLVDSKLGRNIGTFDRDAYTPMYPDVEYFETKESREKVKEMLKDLPEELARNIHHSLNMYVDGNTYNSGLEYLFLKEKGEETGIQKTPRRYPYLTTQKIKDMLGRPDLDSNDSEGLLNAYEALSPEQKMEFNLFYHADGDPAKIEADRELLNDKDSKGHKWFANFLTEDIGFGKLDQFFNKAMRDEREAGKENMALTIEEAVNTVAQKGYGKEFSMWLENKINDLGYDEKIFLGYTPSGNRRYMPNTLENVSKYMKSMGRNASEDHSFGPGLIKSKLAQKFTKLSQIAAQRDRLVNYGQNEEMESVDNRLRSLMESFMDYSKADSYGLYTLELIAWDYVQKILMQGKSIDSVIKEYEEKEGHKVEMTEEQKKDYEKLRDDIKNMPVHYFETKFERPVHLNEFAAAVVPSDINPGLKEALSDAGLPIFEYDKSSDASRREATLKAAEGEGIMFSKSFASAQEVQKQPNGNYPSDAELNEDIYFSLTKNNRATISSWLGKREDLSQEQRDSVMAFLEEMENPTLQLATAKWFTQGVVRLPEDMPKIEQAVAVARKAKVDPLQYASPMELVDKHADITLSEKPIDPDTVSTLHRASEIPEHGIVVYDVEDSEESRQNMRRIINTHFGKEASPWCLLQGDGEGNLTESSAHYWKHYDGYPKQVVFRNGKLLAFSANDSEERLWWDRQDSPHRNMPAGRLPLEGDKLGRSADYIYTKNGKLLPEQGTHYYKGNTQNGDYSEWLPDGTLSETGHYTNGKEDGEFVSYWDNGNVASLRHYKNGLADGLSEDYYTNGNVRSRFYWKDDNLDGVHSAYYENGNLWTERSIRNGRFDGPSAEYYENGLMKEYIEYKNGKKDGVHRRWNSNGVLMEEEHFKNDEREGESRSWYGGGAISAIENYKNNRLDGIQENYEWDGWGDKSHLLQRNIYENGEKISSEEFFRDGRLYFKKSWDNEGRPNGVWKFWSPSGELTRMEAYNHSFLDERNLLAEGVTEEQADNLQFSKVTDPAEIERLENEDYVTVYRAMELIDGQLYPPMSQKEPNAPEDRGKRLKKRQPSAFNEWERSDEQPDRAYEKDGKWYFDLKKNAGSDVNGVLYNPYFHTSTSPLNDQFSSASTRPNLVVVECRIPKSERTSGYKAEKANDSVGPKDWHSGTVTAQIGEGREVILSRWVKPIRIVPDSEVADIIAPKLLEKNISVPYNVITPGLREELEKKGVDIIDQVDEDNAMFSKVTDSAEIDADYLAAVEAGDMETASRMVASAARREFPESAVVDEFYVPKVVLHGTRRDFNAFDPEQIGSANDAGWLGRGFYFYGNNPTYASQYANFNNPKGGRVIKAYLNITNPYWASVEDFQRLAEANSREASEAFTQQLKEDGYDGVYYNGDGNEEWVAFYPNQIKSAEPVVYDNDGQVIPLSKRFNIDNDDIRFAKANANQEIFVSNAERAVENINMGKATPQQWLAMLEKNGGIKAGEDKWLGLSDWLRSSDRRTLDKQEVLDFIDQNKIQIEEVHYAEDVDIESWFKKDVQERIANGKTLDELQNEIDELASSPQRYDAIGESDEELDGYLMDAMKEAYGDDFELGYTIEQGAIEYNYDPYSVDSSDYNLMTEGDRVAHNTRIHYTTEGLDNKREIALTVPTIEPWNEHDEIHFGDAGEGRAVAWVRFGDTKVPFEHKEFDNARETRNDYIRELEQKYHYAYMRGGEMEREKMTDEERAHLAELNERVNELSATTKFSGEILFIDEIQSKRHQEGREHGYVRKEGEENMRELGRLNRIRNGVLYDNNGEQIAYTNEMDARRRDLQEWFNYTFGLEYNVRPSELEINEDKYQYYTTYDGKRYSVGKGVVSREGAAEYLANYINDGITSRNRVRRDEFAARVPDAPFEKNWHELAMKRMLRLAAEEGYDYVAWTTGDQQAERYDIGRLLQAVDKTGANNYTLYLAGGISTDIVVDDEGTITETDAFSEDWDGKKLSEVVGKELSMKMMQMEVDSDELEHIEKMHIGAEGMRGFYDDILVRFVNKYAKKWGVQVQDIELPNVEESARIAHAIPVTPEMKASVMEGQLMFSKYTPEQGKKVVTEFQKKYTPLAKMFALATESRSERLGDYNKNGRIVIFVSNADSEETVEQGCFHENFHAFGVQAGLNEDDFRAINEFFFSGVDEETRKSWEEFREELKQDNEYKKYPEQEIATRLIAGFMQTQNMARVLKIAANRAPEVYDQINNFFNRLGYEPERESAERGLSVPRRYPEGNDGNPSESERTATGREATVEGTPVGIAGNIALTHAIEGIKGKFGPSVKINAVSREQMPRGHKQEKGYYDTRTGEVYICVDNVDSIDDAIATIMHECVAHLGLRRLFGERFPEAMRSIYEALTPEARREVNASMGQNGWDAITAMEEYLARLAEKEDFTGQEQNLWDRIKEIFERVLAAITGRDYVALTDNELRYILQASWLNLTEGRGTQLTLQTLAKDTLLKAKYEVNDYKEPEQLFRTPIFPNGTNALSNYERKLKDWRQIAQMEHQDAQQPTRIGINAIQAETGNKPITEDEDYITKENLASSVAQTEQDEFLLQQAQPILEQIDTLIQIITGKKRASRAERTLAYEDIISYIFAKSGVERNRYNNAKLAREEQEADEKKFKETGNHLSAEERKKYAPRDWSGLTSLFGLDKGNHEEAERLADELCSQFEQKVGKDETDLLWDKIRLATDYNLKHALDHGLLTREQYDKLHGNAEKGIPRMWEYYVPLRGFAEQTAEDVYNYSNIINQQANSVVVKQAKGRTTLADDPIANIINIAMTEIRQGNDNLAKVALYRYVFNRPNSLLQPREMWYVKRGDNTWELAEPEPKYDSKNNQIGTESIEDFDARMEQLKAQGRAFKTARGLHMDKIMTNVGHRNEHLIRLKINGVEKGIWVNGDPKLARAVAGSLRTESLKGLRNLVRPLSNLFTTYSLKFALRNLSRDTLYSRMRLMAMSKEMGRGYMLNYSANWAKNFGVLNIPMLKMVAEWNSGKLQKKEKPTDREKMFMDFMRDGGPTGYTVTQSVDRIKQDIMRQLHMFRPDGSFMHIAWERAKASDFAKLLGVYPRAVQALNESFELLTRFTAYQTSREMGRSRQQSATDAKEISVNFNRRGAQTGKDFWGITAAYLGATHYFYNAGVQGFQNYMGLFRNHPYKMTAFTAKLLVMGFITPLINILLGSGGDGDDDKKNGIEWYWNLPNWTRRNNIVIGGPKFYIAIALGPEQRAIYGLGDIFAALVEGRYADNSVGNLASDIISQLTGLLPFNPVEDVNASSNIGETVLRSLTPDPLMFLVDMATNRDYTGKPLQKENPFVHDNPNCYGAYSSTPDGIVKACQAIAFETAKRGYMIDLHPGYIRDAFKQYGGGIYQTVEEVGKTVAGIFDPDKPFRISNIPLASGIVGSLDEDRTDSFAKNALNEYRKISENEAKALKVLMHEPKITSKQIYTGQVPKDAPEYIKALYDSDAYKLGKIYYEGENGKYLYAANGKQIKKIEAGLKDYRKSYRDKMDEYARMPKETEADKLAREKKKKEVDKAWDELVEAENRIAQRLLDFEYDHPALTKKIESWLKK